MTGFGEFVAALCIGLLFAALVVLWAVLGRD